MCVLASPRIQNEKPGPQILGTVQLCSRTREKTAAPFPSWPAGSESVDLSGSRRQHRPTSRSTSKPTNTDHSLADAYIISIRQLWHGNAAHTIQKTKEKTFLKTTHKLMHKLSFSVVHPAEYALGITVAGATRQTAFLHQAQQRNKNNNIWPQYNTRTCKSSSFQTA